MLTTDRTQPRHDQSTRLARRHLAPRTLTKLNGALPHFHRAPPPVCVIDNAPRHLLREIQEIGRRRLRGLEANSVTPRNRRCDGIRGCRKFAQQWMLAGNVIKPASQPPQFPRLQQSLNRHADGVRRAEIKEIRPGEHPVRSGPLQPFKNFVIQSHGGDKVGQFRYKSNAIFITYFTQKKSQCRQKRGV